jgi:hypothetical protein
MSLTTDKNDPNLNKVKENGQNESYLVLSPEEIAKGFVRPVRRSYIHRGEEIKRKIESVTIMTEEHKKQRGYEAYYAFMKYDDSESPVVGRYLTKREYENYSDNFIVGCQTVTTMAQSIAETYARDPKFYGSTYCSGCKTHLPVEQFVWTTDNTTVGS